MRLSGPERAFVPHYTHDVFVSYAHNDDEPMPQFTTGWVTILVEALKTKLKQELGGKGAKVFIDRQLSCHERVTPELEKTLRESATLLVIFSPSFLRSSWCRKETVTFLAEDMKGRIDAGARVFLVERQQVDRSSGPPEFADLKAIEFWDKDATGEKRILCEFGNLPGHPDTFEYGRRIDRLASQLSRQLNSLQAAEVEPKERAADDQPTVWLAEVTDDLDEQRDEVRRRLEQLGVHVLPGDAYEQGSAALAEVVEQDLPRCKLFVQLLSEIRSKPMPKTGQTRARFQYAKSKTAGIDILQWRSPDLDVTKVVDADHRSLLELARAEGFEDFNRAVKDRALQKPAAPPKRPRVMVFVDSRLEDQPMAEAVVEELSTQVYVSTPDFVGDAEMKPGEVHENLVRNIGDSQALIVIYGSSPTTWVKAHLNESLKILASGSQQLRALAVYVGPPAGKPPPPLRGPSIDVVDGSDGLGEKQRRELAEFVRKIPTLASS